MVEKITLKKIPLEEGRAEEAWQAWARMAKNEGPLSKKLNSRRVQMRSLSLQIRPLRRSYRDESPAARLSQLFRKSPASLFPTPSKEDLKSANREKLRN